MKNWFNVLDIAYQKVDKLHFAYLWSNVDHLVIVDIANNPIFLFSK